jgi:hypothetical protein
MKKYNSAILKIDNRLYRKTTASEVKKNGDYHLL